MSMCNKKGPCVTMLIYEISEKRVELLIILVSETTEKGNVFVLRGTSRTLNVFFPKNFQIMFHTPEEQNCKVIALSRP